MAISNEIIFYRFSPESMPEDVLRRLFVAREKLLENTVREIENAAKNKTPRFYLIVGPRGIGKSHFLALLYYEIRNNLKSLLIPIKLAEEEYSVFRASDLFLRILEEMGEDISDIVLLNDEDEILHASLDKLKFISKTNKKIYIIFIENLHELFKQFNLEELQKLRSVFQKNDIFSIVASAPMIFPDVSEHDEPFYNFFQVQHLGEFSIDEINIFIQKIAEVEGNKKFLENFEKYEQKIHGITHLTGGSPRLVILFYEMVTKGEIENIEKVLLKILDEHTPYYQEIFQLLTGQRRRIFDIIISAGRPVTPKQISKTARLDLPTVNTQLRRMERDGYIISRPIGKYTKYEVRERLFRLWREMRQPFSRNRLKIFLEFLEHWYSPEERKELFKIKFELLEAGEKASLKDVCYYAEVLPFDCKAEALLKITPKLLELGELEEAAYEIQKLKEITAQIQDEKMQGRIPLYEGILSIKEKRYEDALEAFNKALKFNPEDNFALGNKGIALTNLARYEEAVDTLKKLQKIAKNDFYYVKAGIMLAETYSHLNKKNDAIIAIEKIKTKNITNDLAVFIEICLKLSLDEFKVGNQGNGARLLEIAFEAGPKLETDKIDAFIMTFLKDAVDSRDIKVIKIAVEEIIKMRGDGYQEHIKPVIDAVEIIESEDIQRYYDLQVEEREVVADIVRKITDSNELVPKEIMRKESRQIRIL